MKIDPRALELKLIGVREKQSNAETIDMCDRKLFEVERGRNQSFLVFCLILFLFFNNFLLPSRLFSLLFLAIY